MKESNSNPSPNILHKENENYTGIATVLGPHGIWGELKTFVLTDRPESYLSIKKVFIESSDGNIREFEPLTIRYSEAKNFFYFKLVGLTDRTEAENFKKCRVLVANDQLPSLEAGEFYLHQIIGAKVIDGKGNEFGTVAGYFDNGAHSVFEVKGEKNFLLPYIDDVFLNFDKKHMCVLIDPIPGLLS